ncbi:MAG: T9SS type A sorting domain-containing protein [Bacteroidales bacterium]
MKKLALLMILISAALSLLSQSIQNGDFENWNDELIYRDPDPWFSSNMQLYMFGADNNVTRIEDAYHGNYAAHLETVSVGGDTILGLMMICDGYDLMSGGLPYSSTPDSLYCYAKFNIQPNDTAQLGVFFKKNGSNVGGASFTFTGEQPNYMRFSTPVNLTETPDSMNAFASSSLLGDDVLNIPGSEITIDSIGFVGSSVEPFPNGDMENWNNITIEEPENWFTSNFGNIMDGNYPVTKTADSYSGDFAISIENTVTVWGDTLAVITNGFFGEDGPFGGMAVDANPMRVSGYYKYSPVDNDTALAMAFTYHYDEITDETIILDSCMIRLTEQNTFTYFEIPLTNTAQLSDTLNISFTSCNMNATAYPGSLLIIDALSVEYYPVAINDKPVVVDNIYPNPALNHVILNVKDAHDIVFELYDLTGRKIFHKELHEVQNSRVKLDISNVAAGTYIYKQHDGSHSSAGKLVVTQ